MSWRFQPSAENDKVCLTCRKSVAPTGEITYIVVNSKGEYCRQCLVCRQQRKLVI